MVFDNAKVALQKAFPGVPITQTFKLTEGSLRFEAALVAAATQITFNPMVNQGTVFNTETRLVLQDSFVISQIKVCTGAPSEAVDNTFLPDSYPNQVKYGAAPAAALGAFWNAQLRIVVNNDVLVPNMDIYRFYNAPETQQTDALGAGSPGDQDRGSFDGWYPCEPNIVLIGSKNNEITIQFTGPGLADVLEHSRAIIMLRGIRAQNSTVVS